MPLWGIGESRTVALTAGNGLTGDDHDTITRAPAGSAHMEFPTWLVNVDESHDNDRQGAFGDSSANFTTTATSGANDGVDEMGAGESLETDRSAADYLNQTVVRGFDTGSRNGSPAQRLTGGSRGQGFHYEYEYIDTNGNHRRRHECIVATSTNIQSTYSTEPTITNVGFNPSNPDTD